LNLIVTCRRHFEAEAEQEITKILGDFGDPTTRTIISKMPGIIEVHSELDSLEIVKKIRQMIVDEPWTIRYCLRIIPIQKETETDYDKIAYSLRELLEDLKEGESYRISIEKRNSKISSQELISKLAKKIPNKVSLENPDKIILVEVLGNKTGISLITRQDLLSTEKIKRSLSE